MLIYSMSVSVDGFIAVPAAGHRTGPAGAGLTRGQPSHAGVDVEVAVAGAVS
jgi:hypothetical protein